MPLHHQTLFLGFALAAVLIALVIVASVIYRRSKGKPMFRPLFERPLFLETWRSGHPLRSGITRLGGARHCLWVAVNDNALRIAPHFPFNLMFLPEIYGLEINVPGEAVRSVERADGLLVRNLVRVNIERDSGEVEAFEVSLRDPDAFIRAVDAIRQRK